MICRSRGDAALILLAVSRLALAVKRRLRHSSISLSPLSSFVRLPPNLYILPEAQLVNSGSLIYTSLSSV
jgi:hypothetical protein